MNEVCILDSDAVKARLLRLAYEISEKHADLDKLILIGLDDRGYYLAEQLKHLLREIAPLNIILHDLGRGDTDKKISEFNTPQLKGQVVVLIDDVLYTGRTLLQALFRIMPHEPAAIRTLVLIDRGHRLWPVSADYIGLELATTLQEFVSVRFDKANQTFSVYLS